MDYKIHCKSQEELRAVQEHAFKIGYDCRWKDGHQEIDLMRGPFIFVYESSFGMHHISFDDGSDNDRFRYFNEHENKEISVKKFLKLTKI